MASLKEIKGRIGSVQTTLKTTSAMKMVASAKLHKAQLAIESMLPYDRQLSRIMVSMLSAGGNRYPSPLTLQHNKLERVALVAIASNSSLCGGYNSNMVRKVTAALREYTEQVKEPVQVYVIGRKMDQAMKKLVGTYNIELIRDYVELGDKPSFQTAQSIARCLTADYLAGRLDRVELIYSHFKSTATQVPTRDVYLPLTIEADADVKPAQAGYIIEPSPEEVLRQMVPDALQMKVYTVLLDAQAAEHAARTVAMQTATDNGNDLLNELNIAYNKGRQAAITAELLDIVGGSMQ